MIENITLIPFTQLSEADSSLVLQWRNHPKIKQWMVNQNTITEGDHNQFVRSLSKDATKQYYLVIHQSKKIGVVDFYNIVPSGSLCYYGYYLNSGLIGSAFGVLLEFLVIEYAFIKLEMKKLVAETMPSNTAAINLHKRFGFVETNLNSRNLLEAYITPQIWDNNRPHILPLVNRMIS